MHLKEHLENIRENYDRMVADGRVTAVEAMILAGEVGAAIKHLAETFIGSDEHFEMELAGGQAAFQTYIAPIDFPGIPNFMEPFLEQGVIQGLVVGARELRKMAVENNPSLVVAEE